MVDEQKTTAEETPDTEATSALEAAAAENALPAEDTQIAELKQALEQAQTKAQENWDLALRTKAEADNLRRRAERDVENAHKYALERFINELLPVMDSLEMGISAATDNSESVAKLREGSELTLKMFQDVLQKFGVTELNPQGEPFNPEFHQAMSMMESSDFPPNTVMVVYQKGYALNDRLVRAARVVVAKAAAAAAAGGGGGKIDEHA